MPPISINFIEAIDTIINIDTTDADFVRVIQQNKQKKPSNSQRCLLDISLTYREKKQTEKHEVGPAVAND